MAEFKHSSDDDDFSAAAPPKPKRKSGAAEVASSRKKTKAGKSDHSVSDEDYSSDDDYSMPLNDREPLPLECFYCRDRILRRERFIICDTCYAFTSCRKCWLSPTPSYGSKGRSLQWLETQKAEIIAQELRRKAKEPLYRLRWEHLGAHTFDSLHADWTKDGHDFRETTYEEYEKHGFNTSKKGLQRERTLQRKKMEQRRKRLAISTAAPTAAAAATAAIQVVESVQSKASSIPAMSSSSRSTNGSVASHDPVDADSDDSDIWDIDGQLQAISDSDIAESGDVRSSTSQQ